MSNTQLEIIVEVPVGTTGGVVSFEPNTKDSMVNLTDLWKKFGSPANKSPKHWRQTEGAKEFVHTVEQKVISGDLFRVTKGRNGGTWAHWQIALSYMTYLSPEAQMRVNEIVRERIEEERDPELGVARAIERQTKRLKALGKDDEIIAKRIKTILRRNTLTSTLANHGVTSGNGWRNNGFAKVTDAEYLGWMGKTTVQLKKERQVDGNLRDHFHGQELAELDFLESLLEEKIRRENLYGNDQCAQTAHSVGKAVRNIVDSVMGRQLPE